MMKAIRHIQGNVLALSIPLTLRTVTLTDGVESYEDTDLVPDADEPVKVLLECGTAVHEYTPDMDGNVATITDYGTLPVGVYSVAVLCHAGGEKMRFKARLVVKVYDCTEDVTGKDVTWYEGLDGSQTYPILRRNDGQ